MKFQGVGMTNMSGKLGGMVASRNRFGSYMRELVIPVNPASPFQQDVRSSLASLVARWTEVLTPAQRASWDSYALAVPKSEGGTQITLTGHNWFLAVNQLRLQAGDAIIDDAPTIFNQHPGLTSFAVARNAATQNWNVSYTPAELDSDPPVNAETLIVFASRGFNPSRNFFKGPYRFMGIVSAVVGGPASPTSLASPFPISSGLKYSFYGRVLSADGRISSRFFSTSTVA